MDSDSAKESSQNIYGAKLWGAQIVTRGKTNNDFHEFALKNKFAQRFRHQHS